ncbi:response regulator [uncultured Sphingomonas sp.]|uniref:response regulator n=1 Tax=uncultured Sphingomonas sp. TaxID=158754 RepID=UPI0025CF7338|nr:response regulator [uncultured Sphingomonas sp.]
MTGAALVSHAVLVVEDEYYVADDLRRELVKAGATVIGPAPSVERAMALIGSADRIDVAILDINLNGDMIFPVADLLRTRGVPIVFATGYDHKVIPPRFVDVVRCEKPVSPDTVWQAAAMLLRDTRP